MPITVATLQNLVKSLDDYKAAMAKRLNFEQIAKLEAERLAQEQAAQRSETPKPSTAVK